MAPIKRSHGQSFASLVKKISGNQRQGRRVSLEMLESSSSGWLELFFPGWPILFSLQIPNNLTKIDLK